jgi:hypothetical protein
MPLSQTPYDTIGARRTNLGLWFGPRFGQRPGVWVVDPWHRNLDGAPHAGHHFVERQVHHRLGGVFHAGLHAARLRGWKPT